MSKMYTGSIDLEKLRELVNSKHPALNTGKNGKTYLNITLFVNDEEDKYGQIGSISCYNKETKKGDYIGNFKNPPSDTPGSADAFKF